LLAQIEHLPALALHLLVAGGPHALCLQRPAPLFAGHATGGAQQVSDPPRNVHGDAEGAGVVAVHEHAPNPGQWLKVGAGDAVLIVGAGLGLAKQGTGLRHLPPQPRDLGVPLGEGGLGRIPVLSLGQQVALAPLVSASEVGDL
jgi:hypothetical protein